MKSEKKVTSQTPDPLVIGARVRALVKNLGANTSSDFVDALSLKVNLEVEAAVHRAQANSRKTVRATDL